MTNLNLGESVRMTSPSTGKVFENLQKVRSLSSDYQKEIKTNVKFKELQAQIDDYLFKQQQTELKHIQEKLDT
jgi:hypothetical protein